MLRLHQLFRPHGSSVGALDRIPFGISTPMRSLSGHHSSRVNKQTRWRDQVNRFTNRDLPVVPPRDDDTQRTKYFHEHGWKEEVENIKVEEDEFLRDQMEEDLEESFLRKLNIDKPTSSPEESYKALEEKISSLSVPTVAEDFNERQRKYGSYGGDPNENPARGGFNRSERKYFASLKDFKNQHARFSHFKANIRMRKKGKRIPSVPEIVFQLMNPEAPEPAKHFDKQRDQAFRIVADHMNNPEVVKELTKPLPPTIKFDKERAIIYEAEERLRKKFNSISIASTYDQEKAERDRIEEEERAAEEAAEKEESTGEEQTEASEEVLSEDKTDNSTTEELQTPKSGLEALAIALHGRPQRTEYKPNSVFLPSYQKIENELPTYTMDDWNTRRERYPKFDPEPVEYDDSKLLSSRHVSTSMDFFGASFTSTIDKLTGTDITGVEPHPYAGDAHVLCVDMGHGRNSAIPDAATLRRAELIREALKQKAPEKAEDIKKDLMLEKTGGYKPDDPVAFLADLDPDDIAEEQERLIDEKENEEEEREEENREEKGGELERILLDENNAESDQYEEYFKDLKSKHRLPSYEKLDIDRVIAEGGSTADIQKSIEDFLLGDAADSVTDDIFTNHKISSDEDLASCKEFLNTMHAAYGDAPPAEVYNEAIISYVRSEHLRHAMHILKDMKTCGLTPSEDAYSAVVEGFYQNFDITGGDYLRNEMMIAYPESTPPTLELVFNETHLQKKSD